MVCTIPDYEVSTRNPVPSGPPGGGITVAVYRLLATIILVSVLTVVACGDSTSQPPEVAEGEIYTIAKDKATGSVVDETKYSDVRQSGICEDLAIESAALTPTWSSTAKPVSRAALAIVLMRKTAVPPPSRATWFNTIWRMAGTV